MKATFGIEHVPQQEIERTLGHLAITLQACAGIGPGINARQLGVVIQHLLKVRHEPDAIRAVAVEPAPQVIANPAEFHPRQCEVELLHQFRGSLGKRADRLQ